VAVAITAGACAAFEKALEWLPDAVNTVRSATMRIWLIALS
jgi:hypothetical protein